MRNHERAGIGARNDIVVRVGIRGCPVRCRCSVGLEDDGVALGDRLVPPGGSRGHAGDGDVGKGTDCSRKEKESGLN